MIKFREKEIFEKKGAKIETFLFLQGISCHKFLQKEWIYHILRKNVFLSF